MRSVIKASVIHCATVGVRECIHFLSKKILGLKIEDGKVISVTPNTFGLTEIEAEIPVADGILKIKIKDGKKRHYIKKI